MAKFNTKTEVATGAAKPAAAAPATKPETTKSAAKPAQVKAEKTTVVPAQVTTKGKGGKAAPAPTKAADAPKGKAAPAPTKAADAPKAATAGQASGTGVRVDATAMEGELYSTKLKPTAKALEARETSLAGIGARILGKSKKPLTMRELILAIDADSEYQARCRTQNPTLLITRVRDFSSPNYGYFEAA